MKLRILSLCIVLIPCYELSATSGLEVVKWGGEADTRDVNVGIVTPVDVSSDACNKFRVQYGNGIKKSTVEIIESGRIVYTDVNRNVGNTMVNYAIVNTSPEATYVVRVKVDGAVRSIEEFTLKE